MFRNWLMYIVIFLLIVNFSLLGTFIVKQRKLEERLNIESNSHEHLNEKRSNTFMHVLRDQAKLEPKQINTIRKHRRNFHNQNRKVQDELEKLRYEFYQELSSGNPDSVKLSELADEIGRQHAKMMKNSYNHYLDIRKSIPAEKANLIDSLTIRRWNMEHHKGNNLERRDNSPYTHKERHWRHQ